MFGKTALLMLGCFAWGLAGPAFADGKKGGGPTYTPPAVLTPHAAPQPGHSYRHATNPRPLCRTSCDHTPVYRPPVRQEHRETRVVHTSTVEQGLRLDAATIASMNGGVGVGVNDVFVGGGGGFGTGFSGSGFGARSSGFFARRSAVFQRSFSSSRRGRRGGGKSRRGGRRGGRR